MLCNKQCTKTLTTTRFPRILIVQFIERLIELLRSKPLMPRLSDLAFGAVVFR